MPILLASQKALDATVIEWDLGADAKVSSQSLRETRFKGLSATNEIFIGNQIGDLASAEKMQLVNTRLPMSFLICAMLKWNP